MQLTDWFEGVTPARPGVWEVSAPEGLRGFAYWDWLGWRTTAYAPGPAFLQAAIKRAGTRKTWPSRTIPKAWRGLAEQPK